MRQAKKKSDQPYIKPPDGVQIIKQVVPASAAVVAIGKLEIAEEEKQKIQGISVSRDLSKLKTISISAFNLDKLVIEKKQTAEEKEEDTSHLPADKFEKEKLIDAWMDYANKLQDLGKESLYVTLIKRHPEMMDELNYKFYVDNKVQEQDMEKEKPDLMEYIRTALNNFKLVLHIEITSDENSSQILYTSRDKFKKMAEKNPNLLTFKQKFNLDLEF